MSTIGRSDPRQPLTTPTEAPAEAPDLFRTDLDQTGAQVDSLELALLDGFDQLAQLGQIFGLPAPAPTKAPQGYPLGGDALLADVARGTTELDKGATGPSVEKLQTALLIAGYKLPRYGVDGDLGNETAAAIRLLQKDAGLPETGRVDSATLTALEARAAAKLQYPEYDKLFKDNVLTTTLAVGFDEGGAHTDEILELRRGLRGQGFTSVDVSARTPDELRKLGIDPARVDPEVDHFVKTIKHEGKDVQVVIKLVTPDTANAKDHFGKAMGEDEVVVYTGHGRVGSGPDFDHRLRREGNYVIGRPYDPSYVKLGSNDLARTKMTGDYQLMFFDGCDTNLYVDDLRKRPRNKDSSNLDIVGANTSLDWSTSSEDVLAFVSGITSGKSMNEIKHDLEAINRSGPRDRKSRFLSDGFGDNPQP